LILNIRESKELRGGLFSEGGINVKLAMIENEFWFGGYVHEGDHQPIGENDNYSIDLRVNTSPNQSMPLFLSTKGRYIWGENGFRIAFEKGDIEIDGHVTIDEGFGNLKGAYLQAMKKHFPFKEIHLDLALFNKPIYNSWIELTFYQNEADILHYADSILENGMPPGVLMIDDGWSDYYGEWVFSKGKFPNPKRMIQTLHDQGFHIMLWISPYVTPDTTQFRELRDLDLLIKSPDNKPYILEWWNGYSAVLDFSNPKTNEWMKKQLNNLLDMGIDGFKFDGGDSRYYATDNLTYGNVTPEEQSQLWTKFGEDYDFNEFRFTTKAGGMSLLQRLADKDHSWGRGGISSLVPHSLLQGITGHPFCSPDMIGGGQYLNFIDLEDGAFDQELFVRHSEIACLMPAMQFSASPYRILNESAFDKVLKTLDIRKKYQNTIEQLVMRAKEDGEPIIRYMTYEFPDEPVEKVTDQFMLGTDVLVAPATEKNMQTRKVYLPKGNWTYNGQVIASQGEYHTFPCPMGTLIILEKSS